MSYFIKPDLYWLSGTYKLSFAAATAIFRDLEIKILGELTFPSYIDESCIISDLEFILENSNIEDEVFDISFYDETEDPGIDIESKTTNSRLMHFFSGLMQKWGYDYLYLEVKNFKVEVIELGFDTYLKGVYDEILYTVFENPIDLYVEFDGEGYTFTPYETCYLDLEEEIFEIMSKNSYSKVVVKTDGERILSLDPLSYINTEHEYSNFELVKEKVFYLEKLLSEQYLHIPFRLNASSINPKKWQITFLDDDDLESFISDEIIACVSFIISNLNIKSFRLNWSGTSFVELFPIDKMAVMEEQAELLDDLILIELDLSQTNRENKFLKTFDEETEEVLENLRQISEEVALETDNEDFLVIYEEAKEDLYVANLLIDDLAIYETILIDFVCSDNDLPIESEIISLYKEYKYSLDVLENLYPNSSFIENFSKISIKLEPFLNISEKVDFYSEENAENILSDIDSYLTDNYDDLVVIIDYKKGIESVSISTEDEGLILVDDLFGYDSTLHLMIEDLSEVLTLSDFQYVWDGSYSSIEIGDLGDSEVDQEIPYFDLEVDALMFDENNVEILSLNYFKFHCQNIDYDFENDIFAALIDEYDLGDIESVDWDFVMNPENFEGMDDKILLEDDVNLVLEDCLYDDYTDVLITIIPECKKMGLVYRDAQKFIKKELSSYNFSRVGDELSEEEEIEFMKI